MRPDLTHADPCQGDLGIWTMSLWKDFVLEELTVMSSNSQVKDEE